MSSLVPLSTCKTCGQGMMWTISPRGAKLPLDARASRDLFAVDDHGQSIWGNRPPTTLYVVRPGTGAQHGEWLAVPVSYVGETSYVSHFETCPDASAHSAAAKSPARDVGEQPKSLFDL